MQREELKRATRRMIMDAHDQVLRIRYIQRARDRNNI